MFTGLVQTIGTVRSVEKNGTDMRAVIESDLKDLALGASVCCSGCCLTVTEITANRFAVDISAETLSKTNMGDWQAGSRVNLEPSLQLGDELGGHFVFGHIDGLAQIVSIEPDGESRRITIKAPVDLQGFIAPKGSVSLDGISLTVNAVESDTFSVNIIPHTWDATTLADRQPGDRLNIEIDMLARYVARQMSLQLEQAA